ncbi:arylsulfatase B [Pedobacter sp. UYP30]|uniref:arylsulfatase B n=1 Tax=Pedobacter sp. UYP30 TaxID=1756400 RepID=UPI00339910A0
MEFKNKWFKRAFFFVFAVLLTPCLFAQKQELKKPNIIIILVDDMGWGDVGFHGSDIKTPNIDELAKEGTVLNHFYTSPICSPTRAGLLTGRYPNRFGLRETVIPPWSKFGVDVNEKFLPELLKSAGYQNRAALGKWHLGHAKKEYLPLNRGFTHFYGHYNGAIDYFTHKRQGELDWHNDWQTSFDKGYSTDLISNEAIKCIEDYSKEASPFFLYVAYNAPHSPLQAKKEDLLANGYDDTKPKIGKPESESIDGEEGRGNTPRQTYAAMVNCLDRGIGRILAELKQLHIDENTVVLFFSDNGAAPGGGGSSGILRGHKFQEWDGGVRAPAIIKWPAEFKGGTQVDQVMGYVDVAPTLLTIAGAGKTEHKHFDGINMFSVIKGKQKEIKRDLYLGYGSLVNNTWKIVKAHSGNPQMKEKDDKLFDILKDPSEKKNVKALYPDVYERLLKTVTAYDTIKPDILVPPYAKGRKGFKTPKNWLIVE